MARVLFTAVVADVRNKMAGTVFSKNRYGAYMRTKVSPAQPDTPEQMGIRSMFGSTSSQWRGLTEDQRAAWIGAAPDFPVTDQFGNRHTLSGNTLFTRLNSVLSTYSFATIQDPPAPEAATESKITLLDATNTPNLVRVAITNGFTNASDTVVIYATPPFSAGQSYFRNKLRFLEVGPDALTGVQTITITSAYVAKYGAPVIGKKIGIGVVLVNQVTGQKSPMQTMEVLVTA